MSAAGLIQRWQAGLRQAAMVRFRDLALISLAAAAVVLSNSDFALSRHDTGSSVSITAAEASQSTPEAIEGMH